jgi:hypothetical protein
VSRGHGKIQRFILERAPKERRNADAGVTVDRLVREYLDGGEPTVSLKVSFRAALRLLEREGLVRSFGSRAMRLWCVKAKPKPRYRGKPPPWETAKSKDRQQLAKVLGMVGSEHEGEQLTALRKADALRRKLGLSWSDLIKK